MIPSVNDQKLTTESFSPGNGKWPDWMCDCCGKFYGENYYSRAMTLPVDAAKPLYVEVKGIRYFACSQECSRILFSIHHQYAMREGDPKGEYTGTVTA